jgi:hypothetical protein
MRKREGTWMDTQSRIRVHHVQHVRLFPYSNTVHKTTLRCEKAGHPGQAGHEHTKQAVSSIFSGSAKNHFGCIRIGAVNLNGCFSYGRF